MALWACVIATSIIGFSPGPLSDWAGYSISVIYSQKRGPLKPCPVLVFYML